jgi:beta-mannanase
MADGELRRLAQVARAHQPQVILLRWGHEMDLAGLYPWSANDPTLYRAAFRHVVDTFRAAGATNVRWVWSPAGEPGAAEYYPGDDAVDYVGLTVLGDPEWERDFGHASPRSMSELLRPRYAEIAAFDKPVLIAELGVSGDDHDRQAWLAAGLASLGEFDRVRGVVYFNDRNAPNNHRPTEPDWRLTPALLATLAASGA